MPEKDVIDLPLDKFFLYQKAVGRRMKELRKVNIMDTAASIGGVFSKDGITDYLKLIDGD